MAGAGETTKYPPSEFSQKYAKVLAPDGKLISPDEVFGEGKRFDKDVEEKTRLAFKVTLKKLEKMNIVSEKNKANLELEKIDQIVECFPNTMLSHLGGTQTETTNSPYIRRPRGLVGVRGISLRSVRKCASP